VSKDQDRPKPPATSKAEITVNVEKMPEVLADLRRQIADMVRDAASAESDPRVVARLIAVAARFEVGGDL
jgi:hypothetical protein